MYSNPPSPGPAYSDSGTPSKGYGFFNKLKGALPRADSPVSSIGGVSEPVAAKSRLFPSFTSGQRKRDNIRKLEEDISLLHLQLHQQESHLGKLHQQVQQEQAAKLDVHERLNMQYFKSSLLADMLVLKLLEIEQGIRPVRPAAGTQAQQQTQPQADYSVQSAAAMSAVAPAALGPAALQESSFD
eukprot:GHRR01009872.1.p1 GENE.GHRR01009872.1~~GHRR01009872.1.p1  ORF type:complete len:185 (+),score=55.66 GHRR01009872.1:267-821(+)